MSRSLMPALCPGALALVLALASWASPALALDPSEVGARIDAAQKLLDDWQLAEAAVIAEELYAALPDVPPVQAIVGRVKFHQGDFLGAKRLLERASEGGVDPELLALAGSTWEETKGSRSFASEHFVVRTPPGKDELLAPIALDALEQAYDRITVAFDYVPKHKIAVDILHDARGLANVSTLTVKEIETSGTIALCKFNRLMVTSPKALARGYGWLDTLSHELIHLIISEKAHNEVPIWLHEGLAKYSETLWRGDPGLALEAPSENILAAAVKKNELITFEQMHPSMAKLPSQRDTALAFAEVFTVIEWMHTQKVGGGARARGDDPAAEKLAAYATSNRLLDELGRGAEMNAALKSAVGKDLSRMQRVWKRYLKKRKFKLVAGAEPEQLRFVRNARGGGRSVDEDEDEGALREAETKQARRYVRLGNLLLRRGRLKASTVEYEKARAEINSPSPVLSNRMAQIKMELGEVEEARTLLDETLAAYPFDPQTRVLLGRLALRDEDPKAARHHYERAAWENPFNPEIHLALRRIGQETKDATLETRATDAIRLLSGHKDAAAGWVEPPKRSAFGTLSITSEPWGELLLDGKSTGLTTPVSDLRLTPGKHRVRVRDVASGKQAAQPIMITEGGGVRLNLALEGVTPEQLEQWAREEAETARPAPKKDAPPADKPH
jgi:tetratricopeptide (TPR) repeat protein